MKGIIMGDALPLAVDLDGTVILTDMSEITIKRVLLRKPWLIAGCLWLEITGRRAKWKRKLGAKLNFDPAQLVYHEKFMEWLKQEKKAGRELVLCTASEKAVAEKIANHLDIFDDVMGSEGVINLAGENKRKALVERYGEQGFGYCGNSKSDLAVWPSAGEVIVVNPSRGVVKGLSGRKHTLFE
jgi:phosphoserine phosphatase